MLPLDFDQPFVPLQGPRPRDTAPLSRSYFDVETSVNPTVLSVPLDLSNKRVIGVRRRGKRNSKKEMKREDGNQAGEGKEVRNEQRKGK